MPQTVLTILLARVHDLMQRFPLHLGYVAKLWLLVVIGQRQHNPPSADTPIPMPTPPGIWACLQDGNVLAL